MKRKYASAALLTAIAVSIAYFFTYLSFILFAPPTLEDMRYVVESEQEIRKVEVLDVIREKNKEAMYKIDLNYGPSPVTIPESTYMEYIGEGNNAITVTEETLTIYYGYKKWGIGFETDFSKENGDFKCQCIGATVFPWEDTDTYWTEERILKKAEKLIANKHQALNDRTTVPENAKAFE